MFDREIRGEETELVDFFGDLKNTKQERKKILRCCEHERNDESPSTVKFRKSFKVCATETNEISRNRGSDELTVTVFRRRTTSRHIYKIALFGATGKTGSLFLEKAGIVLYSHFMMEQKLSSIVNQFKG